MFFTYLRRELRRRSRQAIVIAAGLAIGIGLVIVVSSASAGVKKAQESVLKSLYGVGTNLTVSKSAVAGSGGVHFKFSGPKGTKSAFTPGAHISRNILSPTPGTGMLSTSAVAKIQGLSGTSAATGGLNLIDNKLTITIPKTTTTTGTSRGASGPTRIFGGSPTGQSNSFSVEGITLSKSQVGPLTSAQISSGSYFKTTQNTSKVAVLSTSFAKEKSLSAGKTITVGGKKLTIIGIAKSTSNSTDVYIPLGLAQSISGEKTGVSIVYVSAKNSGEVTALSAAIKSAVPTATVSTSSTVADLTSGSIKTTENLVNNLGKWLSILALIVTFIIAGLLMMAAVSRRVREFGTLKAIGWRSRQIVRQVMGEGLALGILGGALGIGLGAIGSVIITAIGPKVTAATGSTFARSGGFTGGAPGGGGSFSGRPFGGGGATGASAPHHSSGFPGLSAVSQHLTAPLQIDAIILGVVLAVLGGLVAGGFGSWRAAKLRPATALRKVE